MKKEKIIFFVFTITKLQVLDKKKLTTILIKIKLLYKSRGILHMRLLCVLGALTATCKIKLFFFLNPKQRAKES